VIGRGEGLLKMQSTTGDIRVEAQLASASAGD
jgi:hypothetical protein